MHVHASAQTCINMLICIYVYNSEKIFRIYKILPAQWFLQKLWFFVISWRRSRFAQITREINLRLQASLFWTFSFSLWDTFDSHVRFKPSSFPFSLQDVDAVSVCVELKRNFWVFVLAFNEHSKDCSTRMCFIAQVVKLEKTKRKKPPSMAQTLVCFQFILPT